MAEGVNMVRLELSLSGAQALFCGANCRCKHHHQHHLDGAVVRPNFLFGNDKFANRNPSRLRLVDTTFRPGHRTSAPELQIPEGGAHSCMVAIRTAPLGAPVAVMMIAVLVVVQLGALVSTAPVTGATEAVGSLLIHEHDATELVVIPSQVSQPATQNVLNSLARRVSQSASVAVSSKTSEPSEALEADAHIDLHLYASHHSRPNSTEDQQQFPFKRQQQHQHQGELDEGCDDEHDYQDYRDGDADVDVDRDETRGQGSVVVVAESRESRAYECATARPSLAKLAGSLAGEPSWPALSSSSSPASSLHNIGVDKTLHYQSSNNQDLKLGDSKVPNSLEASTQTSLNISGRRDRVSRLHIQNHKPPERQAQHHDVNRRASSPEAQASNSELRQPRATSEALVGGATESLGSPQVVVVQQEQLIDLLAEFYAQTHDARVKLEILLRKSKTINNRTLGQQEQDDLRKSMMAKLGLDDASLISWIEERKKKYESLRNATIDMIDDKPNKTIQICHDGPKILLVKNLSRDVYYCYNKQQWVERLWFDLRLFPAHYFIILLNVLIFLIGTTGNVFVCLSVYRNHQLRNVTNYFIVNLAFADLLVIIICLPATVIWDTTLTWFFGTLGCKLIMFLQDVSISVSVLTLTAIAIDRYYAICYPLRFKSNLSQAKRVIAIIWLVSIALMSPDLIFLRAEESAELREAGLDTVLYSDCNYDWTERSSKLFQFVKTILLYFLPFVFMFCAHYKIMQTLRLASKGISDLGMAHQRELDHQNSVDLASTSSTQVSAELTGSQGQQRCKSLLKKLSSAGQSASKLRWHKSVESQSQSIEMVNVKPATGDHHTGILPEVPSSPNQTNGNPNTAASLVEIDVGSSDDSSLDSGQARRPPAAGRVASNGSLSMEPQSPKDVKCKPKLRSKSSSSSRNQFMMTMHNRNQLESRDKAAKMLMAIAVIFGVCFFPVHCINFLRQYIHDIPQNDVTSLISMLSHSICYLNSAINPIIYNHMNSVFRAEFKRSLSYLIRLRKPNNNNLKNNTPSGAHSKAPPRASNVPGAISGLSASLAGGAEIGPTSNCVASVTPVATFDSQPEADEEPATNLVLVVAA